jgi:putative tryptophan/tyrosine transport system substrate-binding protein
MRRRDFILAGAAVLGLPHKAAAQGRTPVVGLLWNDSVKPSPYTTILLGALREKGYVVPRSLRIEDRVGLEGYRGYAESAADLVRLKVDVIVTSGTTALLAAAKATKEIPIVTISGGDPVALGLAASLARPGGNVTGIVSLTVGLGAKRIELLKELTPRLSRVGVLLAPNASNPANVREAEAAARALNLQLQLVEVRAADEIESRIDELVQARIGGISVSAATLLSSQSARVVAAIAKHRVPAVYPSERYAEAGGLMTYATSVSRAFVRLAGYVDRILKGARVGDLPMEQQKEFELVINLRTAKALGLKIPQSILQRADRAIE